MIPENRLFIIPTVRWLLVGPVQTRSLHAGRWLSKASQRLVEALTSVLYHQGRIRSKPDFNAARADNPTAGFALESVSARPERMKSAPSCF